MLTVVVPSLNRQDYVLRQVRYWSSSSAHLIIVDGSSSPLSDRIRSAIEAHPRITYRHVVSSLPDRLGLAGGLIKTPYAVMLGDDEFHLQTGLSASVAALEENPDLVGCTGQVLRFTPAVCAITPISHDHTGLLGDTIESIATEKAGIIKSGVPLVVAPQPPAAMSVLRERASAVGAPLIDVRAEWIWKRKMHDSTGQRFALMPAARPQDEHFYQLPLLGAHQVENAALAVALVQQLREQGWSVPHRSIAHGLQTVKWPARCEFFPGKPSLMLDCAHNRASARRLVETLQGYFPGLPWVLVFGAMRDKDVPGMFAELLPSCSAAIMTSIGAPRAMLPSEQADGALTAVHVFSAVWDLLMVAARQL